MICLNISFLKKEAAGGGGIKNGEVAAGGGEEMVLLPSTSLQLQTALLQSFFSLHGIPNVCERSPGLSYICLHLPYY